MKNNKTGKNNILIINSYGPNRGDSAVLQSMIDALAEIEDMKIVVSIIYPEYVPDIDGVEVIPSIPSIDISPWMPLRVLRDLLGALLSRLSVKCLQFLPQEDQGILTKYCEADIILSAGGHHLADINGLVSFFRQWYQLLLAIVIGKPTVIYAQTVGPFNHFPHLLKFLTKFVLNRTKLIMVREEGSKNVVINDLKVTRPPIHVTADSAFLLNPAEPAKINEILTNEGIDESNGRPLIGITVYHAKYHGYSNPEEKFIEYKEIMAKIADYLIEKLDATVIFIPMEMQYEADIPLIINIIDIMHHRNKVKVLRNTYTSKETMGIIGRLDLFIGAKTHSIIFSLVECVPTLCFAYHRKAKEFMEMFGINDYAYDIATLDFQRIIKDVEELISNKRDIKKQMELKIQDVRHKASMNVKLVRNLVLEEVQ